MYRYIDQPEAIDLRSVMYGHRHLNEIQNRFLLNSGQKASGSDRSSSSRNEQYASGTDGLQNEYLWGNIDWPGLILTGRQLQYYLVIRRSVFIIKGQSEKLFVGRHPELHAKNDV